MEAPNLVRERGILTHFEYPPFSFQEKGVVYLVSGDSKSAVSSWWNPHERSA
ncbi:hypothetical protein J2S09_000202 [Bacillus fengqiuensis]|nr:hypothetical protein [Bacillus fengqiuensis]